MKTTLPNYLKTFLFVLALVLVSNLSFSQSCTVTYYTISSGGTHNDCCGGLYDSGGSGGSYTNSENYTTTFHSTTGEKFRVHFNTFDLELNWDYLYVYDGPTTASTLIGTYTGTSIPADIYSTGTDITFKFTSDGSVTYTGWDCTVKCQPTPTVQDCLGAIPLCFSTYYTTTSYSGTGNYPLEIPAPGIDNTDCPNNCLDEGEKNDVWYTFNVTTGGNLDFRLTPNNSGDDYDWAVYNLSNNDCEDIYNNTAALQTSCNFTGATGTTGASTYLGGTTNCVDESGNTFNSSIPVTAGQTYMINISNFSSTNYGYYLDFSNTTASVVDNISPTLQSLSTINCGATTIVATFSENLLCSSVDETDFVLTGPGGPYTIVNVTGGACAIGGTMEDEFTVTVSPAMVTSGTYTLAMSGSTDIHDLCNNVVVLPNSRSFTITGVTASISAGANANCIADGWLTATQSGGTAPYTYLWSNGQTTVTAINLGAGTYTCTVSDDAGCKDITSQAITASPLPVAPTSATADYTTFCSGAYPTINLSAAGGSGTTLNWSTSCGGAIIGTGTPLNITAPAATTTYYAWWTNSCGNSTCQSVTVTVNPSPVAPTSATSDHTTFCAGAYANIQLSAAGGSGTTLHWSTSCGGADIGTGTPLTIAAPASNTTYYAWWSNGCGNSTCQSVAVTVNPLPVAPTSATADHTTFCAGAYANIQLSAAGGSGTTLHWSTSCGGADIGTGTPLSIAAPVSNTTYYAWWTNGCGNSTCQSVAVTVNPLPLAPTSASVDHNNFCPSTWPTISLSVVGGSGTTLNWSTSCGGAVIGTGNPLAIASPVTTPTYYASWTNSCGTSTCASITVNISSTATPPTSASVDHPSFCAGDYANISLTAVGGSGATLNWYSGLCGGTLVGSSTPLIIASPVATTTYYAAWTDACGASTCASTTVTINPLPVAPTSVTADQTTFCAGAFPTINLSAVGGSGTTLNWSTSCGGAVIGTGTPLNIAAPAATTTYYASWTNSCGTTTCANVTITINPLPVAPTLATVDKNNFCPGAFPNIALNATGGSGTTLNWYTGSCGGTLVGTGTPISIAAPVVTTTYYAAWTNSCGVSTCASVTVTVLPLPVAPTLATVDNSNFCPGAFANITLTATGGSGTTLEWYSGSCGGTLVGTGAVATIAAPVVTTNYYASWVNSCGSSTCTSVPVNVFANPIANAGPDASIPNGTSTTLSGSASGGSGSYTYSWSPAGLLVNATIQNPTTTNLSSTTTYTVTVTDQVTGCTGTDQVVITITGGPLAVSTTATPAAICVGGSSQLNALVSGGSGVYTYTWSSNPAGFSSTISNPLVTPIVTTIYTVSVNDGFNTATSSVTVTVNPLPTVYNVTGSGAYCAGGTGLPVCLSGSDLGVNYQLLFNGVNTGSPVAGTGSSICFGNQTMAGTYTVVATNATTSCQIGMNLSAIITINPNPIANAGSDVSIPNGTSTTVNGSASGGTGPYTFSWSPAGSLVNSTIQNPTTVNLSVTTTYILTVTDQATGCTGTDQMTVTITGSPLSASASSTQPSVCLGGSTQLLCTPSGGSGSYTYSWSSSPAGFTSVSQNPLVTPLVTTTYTVTVNDGFSTATSLVIITVNAVPTASAGSDVNICNGSNATLGASGGTTYLWSPSTGLSSVNIANPVATPLTNMTYVVTVTNASGCTASDAVNVNLFATIPAFAGIDQTICTGETAYLNASGGLSFSWSPATGLSSTTIPNPLATPATNTTYIVQTTDGNGCTSSDNVVVNVNPNVIAFAGTDVSICSGSNTTLAASGGTNYSWGPSSGLSATNISNPIATPLYTTTYIVTVSNASGCSSTDAVTVTVNPGVIASAGADVNICSGSSVTLFASGGTTYSWSPNIALSATNVQNPIVNPLATTTYTVVVTGATGCSATDDMTVTVNPTPNADAGTPVIMCNHETAILTATGGTSYQWSNGVNTATNPVTPGTSTTYTVTVSDVGGCIATDLVNVTVLPFTPPVISSNVPTTFCNTTINVTLDASTGYSNYQWNNGLATQAINVTTAGSFYVIATAANGCSDTSNVVQVASYPGPIPPVIVADGPTSFCEGDQISVNLSTNIPYYTYSWTSGSYTPTIQVTHTGNYWVTVTDSTGCSITSLAPVHIQLVPLPVAYMNYNTYGTYVEFYNYSLNDTSYYWTFGDGATSILENPIHTYPGPGTYPVTFVVSNFCGTDSVSVVIEIVSGTGIDESGIVQNLTIYPIPTKDLLDVSFDFPGSKSLDVKLLNTLGQLLYEESAENSLCKYHKVFSLINYSTGVYYLQIQTDQGIVTRKIVVN
jgi:hypothetical protein